MSVAGTANRPYLKATIASSKPAAHLQDGAAVSWQGLDFDFTGAVFDGGNFTGAKFSGGTVRFDGAEFSVGQVDFNRAEFSGGRVSFLGAEFSGGRVNFYDAKFSGSRLDWVNFYNAKFSGGSVSFLGAEFSGWVHFYLAKFSGGFVSFNSAKFSDGHRIRRLRLDFLVPARLLAYGCGLGWPPGKQRRGGCGRPGCRVGLAQGLLVAGKDALVQREGLMQPPG